MILVDTDIFIDFLRGVPAAGLFFKENYGAIAFSAITEVELLSGKKCDLAPVRDDVVHLLAQFQKIPLGNPIAQSAGDLRRAGCSLGDAVIAASAISIDAVLVTRNLKDFKAIAGLSVKKPY